MSSVKIEDLNVTINVKVDGANKTISVDYNDGTKHTFTMPSDILKTQITKTVLSNHIFSYFLKRSKKNDE